MIYHLYNQLGYRTGAPPCIQNSPENTSDSWLPGTGFSSTGTIYPCCFSWHSSDNKICFSLSIHKSKFVLGETHFFRKTNHRLYFCCEIHINPGFSGWDSPIKFSTFLPSFPLPTARGTSARGPLKIASLVDAVAFGGIWRCESVVNYSHPQIDGKVNHHQISRDLLFHLFGDDYLSLYIYKVVPQFVS